MGERQGRSVKNPETHRLEGDLYVNVTFLALALSASGLCLVVGAPAALEVLREGTSEYVTPLDVAVSGGALLIIVLFPIAALGVLLMRHALQPASTWAGTIATAARVTGALAGLSVLATFLLA
ncbi:hypothetical protein ACOACQ_23685 [Nocardioides sp. CPCC 206347]|uniref:hypothetical protein n=1 Tax=unclassified Nocardioides TaxID=2615069 RepID=UPI003612E5E7